MDKEAPVGRGSQSQKHCVLWPGVERLHRAVILTPADDLSKVVAVEHAALGQEAEVVIPTCEKPLEQVMVVVSGGVVCTLLNGCGVEISSIPGPGKGKGSI